MARSDCALNLRTLFATLQALLTSCIQVSQASNITASSTVLPSGTVQRNTTAANSLDESQTTTLASNIFTSALQNSSVSVEGKTSTFLWYSTSLGFGGTTTLPSTTSVISNYSSTRITTSPTTVLVVRGLPDGKVIAVIAGILGALLLILLGVILWNLCIVHSVERRPASSRVEPSDMSHSASELL